MTGEKFKLHNRSSKYAKNIVAHKSNQVSSFIIIIIIITVIIVIIIIIIINNIINITNKLSEKNEEPYHITITLIRTLLSFEILRSVQTCVRGSRTPFQKIPQGDFIDDCRLNASEAGVR